MRGAAVRNVLAPAIHSDDCDLRRRARLRQLRRQQRRERRLSGGDPPAVFKIGVAIEAAVHAGDALAMLGVDEHGLDEVDRNLMLTIIKKYSGGPVGLNTLAAALAEEQDALEEVYEPFLIQIGFLDRTPRGRVATRLAYEHLGIEMPRKLSLF